MFFILYVFLSNNLKRRRGKVDETDEQAYEKVPRTLSKGLYHAEEEDQSKIHLLPIKGKDGIIERKRENIQMIESVGKCVFYQSFN